MTLLEAKIVAEVCRTADSGCSNCVHDITDELNKALPMFKWTVDDSSCPIQILVESRDE